MYQDIARYVPTKRLFWAKGLKPFLTERYHNNIPPEADCTPNKRYNVKKRKQFYFMLDSLKRINKLAYLFFFFERRI
jgi:hypothetical protein